MVNILYGNVHMIRDRDIAPCLEALPLPMRKEITRYKFIHDRKACLLARLLLYQCLVAEASLHLLYHWKRDACHKPYIPGWRPFNISHSGDLVVLAGSNDPIGIDIEQIQPLDYLELAIHFQKQEQEYIRDAPNTQQAFFELWVKKEAALKAIGTGITNGLKRFSCIGHHVDHNDTRWHLRPVQLDPAFIGYICTTSSAAPVTIKRCLPDIIKNLY